MKEKTLLKIALLCGILGICVLFFISKSISIDEIAINKIDRVLDETVVVSGSVIGINDGSGVSYLKIQKDEVLSVTLFGDVREFKVGDYVQIRGKISKGKKGVDFIGEEVRIVG